MVAAKQLAPVALALLLVLAGCGGGPGSGSPTNATSTAPTADSPTPSDTPTATPSSPTTPGSPGTPDPVTVRYNVTVRNGTLPDGVNATRTYARVQSILGTDLEPRPVEIRDLSEWQRSLPQIGGSGLNRALGFENVSDDSSLPSGVTTLNGYVYVHPGSADAAAVERTLAHEFAHSIQYRASLLPWLDALEQPRRTRDVVFTRNALIEGGAVYVADAYAERYLDVANNTAFVEELYEAGPPAVRLVLSPYYFGSRYVHERAGSSANLSVAYERYPRTTEQVIHNYSRDEEPPLSINGTQHASGTNWTYLGNNTIGEMSTRIWLETELDRSRAAQAATGWGTDRLYVFRSRADLDKIGWAWVHRWDSVADADEAASALTDYAAARSAASNSSFRATRVGDETTGLVFGDPGFVANTTVSGSGATVNVTVGS